MQKKHQLLVSKIEISSTKFTRPFYGVCSKYPRFALMQARRQLWKLGIDFLIASCCSSSHIIRSPIFSCSSVADSDYYLHCDSDIFEALDRGDLAVLTLLDLLATFDTVDHTTLIRRLQISYGFNDVVLGWFSSYLHGRSYKNQGRIFYLS